MLEREWDRKLHIDTIGRDDSAEDTHHYPYEPTPYSVLERLAESGYIDREAVAIDYGCGKGRVGFFLNHEIGCKAIGIEFEKTIFDAAEKNSLDYMQYMNQKDCDISKGNILFCCVAAEKYEIEDADVFYFFNPFSVEVLQSVIGKIRQSYYNNPREMRLFFYYPSNEYMSYLMTVPELCFMDEIDCQDLFKGKDSRERIVIFEIV